MTSFAIQSILEKSEEVALVMKQLSHPKKLRLLCHLIESPLNVGELADVLDLSQPQTSQFLKRMELEGLLASERNGHFINYKIKDKKIVQLMKQIKKIFCDAK